MKDIKEIKKEIEVLKSQNLTPEGRKRPEIKDAEYKRAGKKLTMLTRCIYYLETNPNEPFINLMIAECKKRLDFIDKGFMDWCNTLTSSEKAKKKNLLAAYNSDMGTKDYKFQLKALKYILDK